VTACLASGAAATRVWAARLLSPMPQAQMCEAGSKASTLNDRKRWMFRVMLAPTKLRLRSIAK